MAEVILYRIAQTILINLGSRAFDEVALASWGFRDRLVKLRDTIDTIKNVLLDAEERQADNHAIRGWLERLATVVYAADDLFDEVATIAAQKQLMGGNRVTKEVRTFFSCFNRITLTLRFSEKIKKIRGNIEAIIVDGNQFQFVRRHHEKWTVTSRTREQTMSCVDTKVVIGRDGDKKAILDMFTTTSADGKLPIISILGMGGMGKTTLAQVIYNAPEVKDSYELRLWVSVSDVFGIKEAIRKTLMSATQLTTPDELDNEPLQGLLREKISERKYFLVLDDVWDEILPAWDELRALLKAGKLGSKILITTRSWKVGNRMSKVDAIYELKGLSETNSWELFQKLAFIPGQPQHQLMIEVRKEIVKKCSNVPLVIKVVGNLLCGKDESRWKSFKTTSIADIDDQQKNIMNILKLSYENLSSPLMNCFAYCTLFSKHYKFYEEMLIELWTAEGFIIPDSDGSQSLEEIGQQYFDSLVQMGLFQDIQRNSWGAIERCKIHDVMHDLAREVAGVRCKVVKLGEPIFDRKLLHLSVGYQLTSSSKSKIPNSMEYLKLLRTFLLPMQIEDGSPFSKLACQQLLKRFSKLRVLDLNSLGLTSLPSSISQLVHLRFLNLSYNPIEKLPDTITNLWNLQTLRLFCCTRLRTLPINMRKLTNLRNLNVRMCHSLTHMSSGFEELTSLNKLTQFIVGLKKSEENSRYKPSSIGKLTDLKNLQNLRGALEIVIHSNFENNASDVREEHLSCKHNLTYLKISFSQEWHYKSNNNCRHDGEAVLQGVKPPSNIRRLYIESYSCQSFPVWARMDNLCVTLPYLVEIRLGDCESCQLPIFSQLLYLKYLDIYVMESVEYMEDGVYIISSSNSSNDKRARVGNKLLPVS